MDLSYEFALPVPPEKAFAFLTDLERVAPCMPGAELRDVDGDIYKGFVKVRIGPITAAYRGDARLIDVDRDQGVAVLHAKGREMRGQGSAEATVTATVAPTNDATRVRIEANLNIAGRAAQFGRGVLEDVSEKLFQEFVDRLKRELSGPTQGDPQPATTSPPSRSSDVKPTQGEGAVAKPPATAPGEQPSATASKENEVAPLDLLSVAGGPLAKRLLPLAAATVVIAIVLRRWRRSSH